MTEAIYGVVYCLTSPSGKQYVGQTVASAQERFYNHKACAKRENTPIAKAVIKYGDLISVEQIDIAVDQKDLDNKEKYWIGKLDTLCPSGYNLKDGGNGNGKHSDLTIAKMSKARKGRKHSKAHCAAISAANLGKKRPRISAAKMGHEVTTEAREKISLSLKKRFEENGGIQHGTTTGYSYHCCRCVECKAARSTYRKALWKNHKK